MPRIRPIAIVLLRKGERLLVMDCTDPAKRERFYRPPGGGIHFGERAAAAARRERRLLYSDGLASVLPHA